MTRCYCECENHPTRPCDCYCVEHGDEECTCPHRDGDSRVKVIQTDCVAHGHMHSSRRNLTHD